MKNYVVSFTKSVSFAAMVLIVMSGCSQKQAEPQSQTTTQNTEAAQTQTEQSGESATQLDTQPASTGSNSLSEATETTTETVMSENSSEQATQEKKLVPVPASLQFAVVDPDGNGIQSQNWFTGGPVVLNFWGTWCPPCRREVPALVEINNEFAPKGVKMVSLSYNDTPDQVKKFVAANGMNWEQVLVDQDVVASFGIEGFPTTIFYTADGKELGRMVGGRSHADFHQAFSMLVK